MKPSSGNSAGTSSAGSGGEGKRRSNGKRRWYLHREYKRHSSSVGQLPTAPIAPISSSAITSTLASTESTEKGELYPSEVASEAAEQTRAEEKESSDCDICNESIDQGLAVVLGCQHEFCAACSLQCVRSGLPEHPGRPVRFNTLFCPFRCGACFDTALGMSDSLATLVTEQVGLMRRAEVSALNKLRAEGLFTEELQRTCVDVKRFALNTYSTYLCRDCRAPFPVRQLCGADDESSNRKGLWCPKCTKLGSANLRVSVYVPDKKGADFPSKDFPSKEMVREGVVCLEDVNAQQMEVEALQAMYPDAITVLHPPPSRPGETGAILRLRCPTPSQYDDRARCRLASELSLRFELGKDYPSVGKVGYTVDSGTLTLAEFDHFVSASITEHLDAVIASKPTGEPCVFDVTLAYLDWLYLGLDKPVALRNAQKHRLYIAEHILTMRCPREHCRAAVLDFAGCFALSCNACGCGFCGWCLQDCGNDAHDHVLGCVLNKFGGFFAPFAEFERVHCSRRRHEILEYVWDQVPELEQSMVLDCIRNDLKDVGIVPIAHVGDVQYGDVYAHKAGR